MRHRPVTLRAASVTMLLGAALLGASASPAYAAEPPVPQEGIAAFLAGYIVEAGPRGQSAEAFTPAPSCVRTTTWSSGWYRERHARVTNDCSGHRWIKVLWAYAPDTACTELAPGNWLESSRSAQARYDGTVSC